MAYKLNIKRDLDITPLSYDEGNEYFLWLPFGYRFSDDLVHCRGYDTLADVKKSVKTDVIECDCMECSKHTRGTAV
jgi:hypothetical protein